MSLHKVGNYCWGVLFNGLLFVLTALSPLCIAPITARVCDNELLRCQNGGMCINNLRCNCPAAYTGLQCEKRRCETELGGCGGPNSGHVRLWGPSSAVLLLLPLLLLASCWATIL